MTDRIPFYRICVPDRDCFIEASSGNDWSTVICDDNPYHQRPGVRLADLKVQVISSEVVDFSQTPIGETVITDRASCALRAAGLSGFQVRPVDVVHVRRGLRRDQIPRLWEMVVTGGGRSADSRSGIWKIRECASCGLAEYSAFENGLFVDESTFDGSDFLTVLEYPGIVLVNLNAKSAIEKAGLTNVSFSRSEEMKWPSGVVRPC